MKKRIWILLALILVIFVACDFGNSDGDCDDDAEDAYVANVGASQSCGSSLHPSQTTHYEFCDPHYLNCTCTDPGWSGTYCTNCVTQPDGTQLCDCDYLGETCSGCIVQFEDGCTRSPEVYDNGLLCGRYPHQNMAPCAANDNNCIHENGYAGVFQGWVNGFIQCFIAKHLDLNGRSPATMSSYVPLPCPTSVDINGRLCTGAPEDVVYHYDVNGLSITVANSYAADCIACGQDIVIDGASYSLRNDPDCGRDVPGSGWNGNYCDAGVNETPD